MEQIIQGVLNLVTAIQEIHPFMETATFMKELILSTAFYFEKRLYRRVQLRTEVAMSAAMMESREELDDINKQISGVDGEPSQELIDALDDATEAYNNAKQAAEEAKEVK